MNQEMNQIIQKEFNECKEIGDGILDLKILNDYSWQVVIKGPKLGPYEKGQFFIHVLFPKEYPKIPPKFRVLNKIYHMNINQQGCIALNTLKKEWSENIGVKKMLLEILSLFQKPNPQNPLNLKLAQQYQENCSEYYEKAQQWTQQYATFIDIKIE
ncbi:unnamed protein product [Paramecium pentaurelia]|uniref:UBC core domain-containing protein n=1 Tax=Paramecium pentaurelia TaxID=43138 RepID=A0A8S1X9N8_9CILI|nr:unnamed protein product [Paramecium pentaurelia]